MQSASVRRCRPCLEQSVALDTRSFRHGYRWGVQSARAGLVSAAPAPPPHPGSGTGPVDPAALHELLADAERRILAAVDDRAAAAEREAAARAEALRASLRGVRDGNEDLRRALGGLVESLRGDLRLGAPDDRGQSGPAPGYRPSPAPGSAHLETSGWTESPSRPILHSAAARGSAAATGWPTAGAPPAPASLRPAGNAGPWWPRVAGQSLQWAPAAAAGPESPATVRC